MKSVLITGGMGFIGANCAVKFIEEGYKAILYDIAPSELDILEEKKGQWEFVMGDVQDWRNALDAVRKYEVEGIVHCALPVGPMAAGALMPPMAKANFDACYNLLEVCRLEKLKFVYISSNAAYGYRPDPNPMVETDYAPVLTGPRAMLDEYGAMKVMCETLTAMYHDVHGVDSVSCRTSWVYGPATKAGWYPQWFLSNALAGKPAKLEKGGDHKTDYTYVKDTVRGVFLAFTVRPLKHRLYNITSGRKVSAREVVETVRKVVPGADIEVGPGQMEKGLGNLQRHALQVGTMLVTRAEEDLGYTTTPLEQGLRETAEWLKKRPEILTLPDPP